jgi:hypothetical protein
MKRDDFGMRIDEIRELATKYSKPDLARMVQMGMIEPQKALMAGMMIDRIAKSAMSPPQSTVAQEVFGVQPGGTGTMAGTSLGAQGQELGPTAPMTMAPPAMAASGGIMSALPHSAGVAGLPSGLQNMAGGGIVAFADGGKPEDMVRANDALNAALGTLQQDDGLTLPGGFRFREYNMPKGTDIKSEMAAQREAEREAGVDTDLYKRMREEEAGRREELKGRREEAKGEALLLAGLGLMGARRGQEFETLANVGRQAVAQYSGALREIRDTERDIKKTERELAFAEDRLKRDQSARAKQTVDTKTAKLEDLQTRQTDQYNKAAEKSSDLFITKYGIDENAKKSLEVAKMSGEYQLAVARIHERSAGRPGETERLLARYHDILAKQGPEAAAKFMGDVERVRGAGKPQNITSFEEALKIVSNNPKNFGKSEAELAQKAKELMAQDPMRMGQAPTAGGSRPPTTFNLSPEAQKALQQYGGR